MLYTATSSVVDLHIRTFILILTIVQYNPLAYNINAYDATVLNDPTRVSSERASYFGFSVALYSNTNSSLILVGAPRANSIRLQSVKEPGTVFKCTINNTCTEWVLDESSNEPYSPNKKINQIKDNAWIGATLAIENKTKAGVVVCGPRWINNVYQYKQHDWYLNGICYWTLATDSGAFSRKADRKLLPLTNVNQIATLGSIGIYNYAMGQAGFSLHINSQGHNLNLVQGSPGLYSWKGNIILTTINTTATNVTDDLSTRTVIPSSAKEDHILFNSYFGYAITSGSYFDEQEVYYASGAPRGDNMCGKVLVFTFPRTSNKLIIIKTIIYGKQLGEYFGAALTSCDINNDHKHELIIGAPQWSKDEDEGRVYIYTVRRNNNLEELQTIPGEIIGGRFGTTVTCLGDIDYDGYGDIAIGAPYEEENGGAVYIFNGNRKGVLNKYSQRLRGIQFSPNIRGFGISISEPRDINNDNYSDIAVGAHLCDKVVLLKSVPVITVNVTLAYSKNIKLTKNTSFFVDLYTSYNGIYIPTNLRIVTILKIDQLHGRATYQTQKGNNNVYRLPNTLHKAVILHNSLKIHLMDDIQNVIDPIEISASIHVQNDLYANDTSIEELCTSCVVINKLLSKTEDHIKLPFAVDCGEDNKCMSNLGVKLHIDSNPDNRYIIGSTPTMTLRIDTYNRGEPAYQARVHIYTNILPLASIPPECTENSRMNAAPEIICNVGNPLRTNKTLTLQLDMSMVQYDVKEIELQANITTQSDEVDPVDNSYTTIVHFDVEVDIAIAGKAPESLYSYSSDDKEEAMSSLRFQHVYEVQKFGVSPIEEAVLTVKIPTLWRYNTEETALVNINNTFGKMDGYQFYCNDINKNEISFGTNIAESQKIASVNSMNNNIHAKFNREKNTLMSIPPENRTLYVNCTNTAVQCVEIDCKLGSFTSSLSVAKFVITLDLQLSNFYTDLLKDKDIIFVVSEGSVTITKPSNIIQKNDHKPDTTFIATTFLGSPVAQPIAVWIIAASVFFGVIFLILLILGLIKIGFFNRKKKMELEALKAEDDKKYLTLEITSSTEVLN